ncbi:MAG: O-antigen ligase family protein [Deltaproteobacteria bacterium]|nr:O-antigen ligase family protein [Deltaproteobacteria bacterium]
MKPLDSKPGQIPGSNAAPAGKTGYARYLDAVIENGVVFLVLFMPLAFGGVQQWAISVMETAAFVIFGAWLLKMCAAGKAEFYKTPILYALAAFIAVAAAQMIPMPVWLLAFLSSSSARIFKTFSNDAPGAWRTISIDPQATMAELWKLLSYAAVFIVIINHYRSKEQAVWTLKVIVWLGVFLAVFAVVQKVAWNGRLYWIYPVREGIESNVFSVWGPYINHNHFAGYMELAIPVALGLLLYRATDIRVLPDLPFKKKLTVWADSKALIPMTALSAAVLVMGGVLFMTLSRGGIIGLASAVAVFIWMALKRRALKKKAGVLALVGAALIVVVVLLNWSRMEARFGEIGHENRVQRTDVWSDAMGIAKDFPMLGSGLGTFKDAYPMYQTKYSLQYFVHAESDYVETLTETGIIGFAAAMVMVFHFFYPVVQVWRVRQNTFVKCMAAAGVASIAALAVHGLTDFNMRIPANAMTATVVAAVTYAIVFNVSDRGKLRVVKSV